MQTQITNTYSLFNDDLVRIRLCELKQCTETHRAAGCVPDTAICNSAPIQKSSFVTHTRFGKVLLHVNHLLVEIKFHLIFIHVSYCSLIICGRRLVRQSSCYGIFTVQISNLRRYETLACRDEVGQSDLIIHVALKLHFNGLVMSTVSASAPE